MSSRRPLSQALLVLAACVTAPTFSPHRFSRHPFPRRSRPSRSTLVRLVPAALLACLAGCGGTDDPYAFPPVCPNFGTAPEAAQVTRFRDRGTDLTDMAIEARITAPRGHCSRDEGGRLKVETYVRLRITRGPAATGGSDGRSVGVDYFIAVTDAGQRILAKYPLHQQVTFPPNVDRLDVTGETQTLSLPTRKDKPGSAFTLLSGFQLSPAELAFNRQHGAP